MNEKKNYKTTLLVALLVIVVSAITVFSGIKAGKSAAARNTPNTSEASAAVGTPVCPPEDGCNVKEEDSSIKVEDESVCPPTKTPKTDASEDTKFAYMSGVYIDTVIVVATDKGYGINAATVYKEIKFNNDLYMMHIERNSPIKEHRDYNHPFYVETGDVCVVWVEFDNRGKEEVKLLENLTKADNNNVGFYFSGYVDYD